MPYKRMYLKEDIVSPEVFAYMKRAKEMLGIPNVYAIAKLLEAGFSSDPFRIANGSDKQKNKPLPSPSPPRPSGPTEEQRAMQRAMRAKYEAEQAEKNKTKETP